jgi:fumarate reductase subunit D
MVHLIMVIAMLHLLHLLHMVTHMVEFHVVVMVRYVVYSLPLLSSTDCAMWDMETMD